MGQDVTKKVAALRRMTVPDLRRRENCRPETARRRHKTGKSGHPAGPAAILRDEFGP
jgi:hypothetical protein